MPDSLKKFIGVLVLVLVVGGVSCNAMLGGWQSGNPGGAVEVVK